MTTSNANIPGIPVLAAGQSMPIPLRPHDWVLLVTFKVDIGLLKRMADERDKENPESVQQQLDQEHIDSITGPGCRMCGLEWTVGWGKTCAGGDPREMVLSVTNA